MAKTNVPTTAVEESETEEDENDKVAEDSTSESNESADSSAGSGKDSESEDDGAVEVSTFFLQKQFVRNLLYLDRRSRCWKTESTKRRRASS